jgi:hypothetical protein
MLGVLHKLAFHVVSFGGGEDIFDFFVGANFMEYRGEEIGLRKVDFSFPQSVEERGVDCFKFGGICGLDVDEAALWLERVSNARRDNLQN